MPAQLSNKQSVFYDIIFKGVSEAINSRTKGHVRVPVSLDDTIASTGLLVVPVAEAQISKTTASVTYRYTINIFYIANESYNSQELALEIYQIRKALDKYSCYTDEDGSALYYDANVDNITYYSNDLGDDDPERGADIDAVIIYSLTVTEVIV